MGLELTPEGPKAHWELGTWALKTDKTALNPSLFPRLLGVCLTLDGLLPPLSLHFSFCKKGHGRPHLMEACGHYARWSPSIPRGPSTRPFVVTSNCKGKRRGVVGTGRQSRGDDVELWPQEMDTCPRITTFSTVSFSEPSPSQDEQPATQNRGDTLVLYTCRLGSRGLGSSRPSLPP